ncbi:hypothetical protein BS47DRAFT_1343042 [Hydnum rufescens UP504]|uniref:Uncharacterized protein n=1 Tax=Hydnum rufescens UP504 TaxID=1448309 RepID=A0A9P6DXC8_9AGAM|nr:hypothetical protein BS47DRAFT_1343042 [Hydnum rufescens UP504]
MPWADRGVQHGVATRPRPWSADGNSPIETLDMEEYAQRLRADDPYTHDRTHDHYDHDSLQFRPLSQPPSFQSYPQSPRPPPRTTPLLGVLFSSCRRSYPFSATRSFTQDLIHPKAVAASTSPHYSHDAYDDSEPKIFLPWNAPLGPIHFQPQLPLAVKEERIRMLEEEFGAPSGTRNEGERTTHLGGLDSNGHLFILGKRKRKATRWAQGFLSLSASISSLYVTLAIHPNPPAPPSGKLPTYLLYLISVATVFYMLCMFVIRPCCYSGRRHRPDPSMDPYSHMAAVLSSSVSHAQGNKSKKKTGTRHQQQPVNVNIIVDPRLFSSHSQPDSDTPSSASHPSGAARPSPFIIIALETGWLRARKALKVKLAVDILICLLWLVTFVVAILNTRCPPGEFQGCVVFGIRDLSTSRVSPRAAASPFRRP